MVINLIDVGNAGILTLGAGPLAVQAQIEKFRVTWSESVTAARKVLSGEELPGKATYTASVTGTAIQDLADGGFVDFTYTEKGEEVPFTFQPDGDVDREVNGICYPVPLDIGGDAGENGPSSDFTWRCKGEPTLDDVV